MTAGPVVPPATLGVVGAGTMGAGIAQLAALAGYRTLLHDPDAAALEDGVGRLAAALERGAERGRWSPADAAAARSRLTTAARLEDLAGAELVIEAAPERLELKRELFATLSALVPDAVLASNTSSIPITAIATAAADPARVVGMHFFNPPPLMRLLELIRGDATSDAALAAAAEVGAAMGRTTIVAADRPGFVVNRCGRPFYAEALRLVTERVADAAQIDRICRLGGGFRMGPFELMDLVGVDVGYAVARSFTELSFGEPRWKPSPLQAHLTAAGRTGRKAGRGYHDYPAEGRHRPADPEPLAPGGGAGRPLAVVGAGAVAELLRERAAQAGYAAAAPDAAEIVIEAGDPPAAPGAGAPAPLRLRLCAATSLALCGDPAGAFGFHVVAAPRAGALIELTRTPLSPGDRAGEVERLVAALGFHHEWVGDAPGLVLGRILAQLANEAIFALSEGVADAADIDLGATLGLAHPFGPLRWGRERGLDGVLATLDGLADEYREERYRAAPALRRAVGAGYDLGG